VATTVSAEPLSGGGVKSKSLRAKASRAVRQGPARYPSCRMRTNPRGSTCCRNRRKKLCGGEGQGALLVAVGVVLPAESNLLAVESQQAVIAERDPVGVAAEVTQDTGAAHGRFGVDHPILGEERVDEGLKSPHLGQRGGLAAEDQLVAAIGSAQSSYQPLAEDPSQDLHRRKETVLRTDPALMIRGQSARRNQAVHMGM